MMNNWNSGWRTLVTWNDTEKVYKYQNHDIIPLTYDEQITMPIHLQNEYYWGEIQLINNVLKFNDNIEEYDYNTSSQKAFDEWWSMVEEM